MAKSEATRDLILRYTSFLRENRSSKLTVVEYVRDAESFCKHCAIWDRQLTEAGVADVMSWMSLGNRGKEISKNTQTRKLSALRKFFAFLVAQQLVPRNFVMDVSHPGRLPPPPKVILSQQVIRDLLEIPESTLLGRRDVAIIHCIYGAALDLYELVALQLGDIDLKTGVLSIDGSPRAALSARATEALRIYVEDVRPQWVKDPDARALFVGDGRQEAITRQAIWKRVMRYGLILGQPISPRAIRDSSLAHAATDI